ncbi:DUF1661 domain-containing protein [Porphyromonas gulae]|nr:DUF1661 domain-containing protein [Porphyromonas gulae]
MRKFFSSRAKTKKFTNHVFTNHKHKKKTVVTGIDAFLSTVPLSVR